MNRDSMIIFGVIGALFLILLVMFLMTAEMFRQEEGYRDRRKAMRKTKKKKMPARKMRRRRR